MKTKEYREKIAAAFIKSLEENPRNWKQEWSAPTNRPENAVTKRPYRGINTLWLSFVAAAKGYTDPRWCTFNQAKKEEWHIKKGEKGTQVEYWMPYDAATKTTLSWNDYNLLVAMKSDQISNIRMIAKYFTVFNVGQMEKVPERILTEGKDIEPAHVIGKIADGMGVEILNDGGNQAFYRPREDKIHLPEPKYFDDEYAYDATVLHELSHATGHPSRLNRYIDGGIDSEYYAYEELVAEISSCFMGYNLPVAMDEEHFENHKAYIQGWIDGIKEKPEVLMKAVKDAQRAADYLELKGGLISEAEYKKQAESTFEVDRKKIENYSEEDSETARMMELVEARSRKGYVKEFIQNYIENYDFDHPKTVLACQIPAMMLEEKLQQGGMCDTDDECLAFINQDPEAAFNTVYGIRDYYPADVAADITAEKNPKQFSLIMMEREIYKMIEDSKTVMRNYDNEIVFDRGIASEICEANNIKVPENARVIRMRVPGIDLEN